MPNDAPGVLPPDSLVTSSNSADQSVEQALARLYGQPLFKLPTDIYIPPDALEIFLEVFEGPLDLLLYLIRKNNFNILDIPMVEVTDQYMAYVEEIRSRNMELAAEYLSMAAMLIEIKSRMLLPPRKQDGLEEEDTDPRAELERLLLEYEKIKKGAQWLALAPQHGRDFVQAHIHLEQSMRERLPDVDIAELQAAWREILSRAKLVEHHRITREELSVREYMGHILKQLQGRRFVEFEHIFQPEKGRVVLVVTFIALLELAKETLIEITQADAYAPLYVRLTYTPSTAIEDATSFVTVP